MLLAPGGYYEERPVKHSQLGDVHDNILFVRAIAPKQEGPPRGRRARLDKPAPHATEYSIGVGVLCHYTCGFVSQPPGVADYSHSYRLMAPLVQLRELKKERGWANSLLRAIRDQGRVHGVLYLPWPKPDSIIDEWTGHAAALLFRPALVSQGLLDSPACPRLARMTEQAQQLLAIGMIQVVSPNTLDPNDDHLVRPDISDGWLTQSGLT